VEHQEEGGGTVAAKSASASEGVISRVKTWIQSNF
jgi:hypothetical protein